MSACRSKVPRSRPGCASAMLPIVLFLSLGPALAGASPIPCIGVAQLDGSLKRPEKPWCIDEMRTPTVEYVFNNCRDEMEDYRSKLNIYLSCLKAEATDAISEYNNEVWRFNCRARGSC